MAKPDIPAMEPNKKLLKATSSQNEKLLKASKYKLEATTHKDHKATSSDERVEELNK
jgi:hypothetical protein